MALAAAGRNGFRLDEALIAEQRRIIASYLESWRERTLQNIPIAGGVDTISYLMLGVREAGQSPDFATDAQAIWLERRQAADGHWPVTTIRPPIESNDIEVTAVSMRALQMYAPKTKTQKYRHAVERAREWLKTAKGQTSEERAFRVLGLAWAKAGAAPIERVALQHARIGMDNPAFRRGVEFLLRTQLEDGSWYVKSRSVPIQAYFESGFPHRADQWISAAATAWATTALASVRR